MGAPASVEDLHTVIMYSIRSLYRADCGAAGSDAP